MIYASPVLLIVSALYSLYLFILSYVLLYVFIHPMYFFRYPLFPIILKKYTWS
ncbi:hypothetical protein BDF14DRAFT_30676 [Spinellus fusiger]|nr:hypothetical protein BDF14DRAFT_30676 [Spinellus fusiger]